MYKELNKYKTENKIDCIMNIVNSESTIKIKLDEYSAGMGNLINDFIEHKNKPFWKRKYYHNHLTKLYIDFLNQFIINRGF